MSQKEDAEHRTLRAMGVTLLGVILSVGATVAFGMTGPWWLRVVSGVAVIAALVAVMKLGTSQGSRGHVARLADWITGESQKRRE